MSLVLESLAEIVAAHGRMLRRHELLLEMLANATLRIARASIDAAEPNEEMTREFEAMLDALQKEREADRSAEWEAALRKLTVSN